MHMTVLRRLRDDEGGFSLTELLAAMAIGSLVLWAAMQVFVTGIQGSSKVGDRVEAAQRGRLAMDRITTVLNAQVCLDSATPPISTGADQSVTFTANLGRVDADPVRYVLRYDSAAKRLIEDQYTPNVDVNGVVTYAGTPSRSRTLATGVVPERVAGTQQPMFRYYQFNADGTINTTPLGTPLMAANLTKVVRVGIAFQAVPERTNNEDARGTTLEGQATLGSADPNDPTKGTNCT
jgi:prepilin-type N-terminal cleavage/methylation domain-containing protein